MKVCLVSQEYPPETACGGIGTQSWNKAHALSRVGHLVHVLSRAINHDAPAVRTEARTPITVHRIQSPGNAAQGEFPVYDQAVYQMGYTWSVLSELERLGKQIKFDVINFPEYGAEGFAYQLNRTQWNWIPVVVQLHGPLAMLAERMGWPDKDSNFYRVATFMESLSIKMADGWMASSTNIADFSSRFYGIPRESIDVVHCGVDCNVFRPLQLEERVEKLPRLLFAGNITATKGMRTVFEAVLRLRHKYPDIRLQIIGKDDDGLIRTLQRRARSEGAQANFNFIGFVADRERLAQFYRDADVFCSPAHHELGVANVYVEAMACGCPVVASTTGGAPEAVLHGQTGLLVPPNDVEATTKALDQILGDPLLRKQMSAAARQRAKEYFGVDAYIRRVLTAYERAIEHSREKLARLETERM